jgi:uncharacterized coiled-coil DUF342 family protein
MAMTTTEKTTEEKINELKTETEEIRKEINEFDVMVQSPDELDVLFKRLDNIKNRVDDVMCELEVEDFLEFGPGIKNKNI